MHHMRLFNRTVAVAGAAALVALMAGITPAAAAPAGDARSTSRSAQPSGTLPDGFANWAEVFAVQKKLNAAADKIVAKRGAGYAGIVAAPQSRALEVYWKGKVPATVTQVAAKLGVPVTFHSAAYSQREMVAETVRLAADPQVLSVGPEEDGSGLTIQVTTAGQAAIRSRSGKVGTATMPLHVRTGAAPQTLSRGDDYSPYVGGAKYTTAYTSWCSTGFAVFYNGLDHMLTAGHCGSNGDTVSDGGGQVMGPFFNDNSTRDTIMIDVASEGANYVDAWDSNTVVDVVAAESDYVGNLVCTNGSRTGEHCGLRVDGVNQSDSGLFPLTHVVEPNGGCAGAKGDSGGPVVIDNWSSLIGRGTISTGRPGEGNVTCPNAPTSISTSQVWYAPLVRPAGDAQVGSLQYYNASIL